MNKFHIKITKNDEIVADADVDCFIGSFHKRGEDEGQDVCYSDSSFGTIILTAIRTNKLVETFLNEAVKGGIKMNNIGAILGVLKCTSWLVLLIADLCVACKSHKDEKSHRFTLETNSSRN